MEEITIQQLSNWFLHKESMTHKKLQKMCYYAVAWSWALMNKNILSDDRFEAWVHGPVAPKLYQTYKGSGWNNIPKAVTTEVPSDVEELLNAVWITYGDKSGNELEALSHSERPWREARGGLSASDNSSEPIEPEVMREFYNSIKSTDF